MSSALRIHLRFSPSASRSLHTSPRVFSGLVVPYVHQPVTPFVDGIPASQVRPLSDAEKKWDFWTSSDAFAAAPVAKVLTHVPYGEVWVVQRFGKFSHLASAGIKFLVPGIDKIKCVKPANPVSMGVLAKSATTKDGKSVDAYAVVYFSVVDPVQSAYYVDSKTGAPDSERAFARLLRATLNEQVAKISLIGDKLSSSDSETIRAAVTKALKRDEVEMGLEVTQVEIRGAFSSSNSVPDKLRAVDFPLPDPEDPGHGLAADYWEDVLTPPFFNKRKFGSQKEVITHTAPTLEWAIPSPPDFHHFGAMPRYVLDTADAKAIAGKK